MSHKITLFTGPTPNGYKIPVFLELLGLKYNVRYIDIRTNEQKEPWYLEMNPNGRIPTLKDESTDTIISESGAILMYLADTYDKERKFSYEYGTKEYYKQLEVIMFQMAGLGPMQGQFHHFYKYAPEKIEYGIKRYTDETKRLYGVVEEYLKRNEGSEYLVGPHISIADVLILGWAASIPASPISFSEFPRVEKWVKHLSSIPEVKAGFKVPVVNPLLPKQLGGETEF